MYIYVYVHIVKRVFFLVPYRWSCADALARSRLELKTLRKRAHPSPPPRVGRGVSFSLVAEAVDDGPVTGLVVEVTSPPDGS